MTSLRMHLLTSPMVLGDGVVIARQERRNERGKLLPPSAAAGTRYAAPQLQALGR